MVGRPAGGEALSYGRAEGLSTPAHDDLIPEEVHTRMLKKRSFWSVGVGALVLMTMLFAACGPSSSTPPPAGPQRAGPGTTGLNERPNPLLPYLPNETNSVNLDKGRGAPLGHAR